jgi:hypothetical protein
MTLHALIDLIAELRANFPEEVETDSTTSPTIITKDFEGCGISRVGLNGLQPREIRRCDIKSHIRRRAEQLGSAMDAFDELENQVRMNQGTARFMMLLTGIKVEEDFRLTSEFSLHSPSGVIFSEWAVKFVNDESSYLSQAGMLPPCGILLWSVQIAPVFTVATDGSGRPSAEQTRRLDAHANLLACAACHPAGSILVCIADDDETIPLPGDGMIYRQFDRGLSGSLYRQEAVDLAQIQSFFHNYENFEGDLQAINIATNRLSRCLLHGDLEDRAIDLGIALEAVLMFSPPGGDRSGINQEIIRPALLTDLCPFSGAD